MRQRQSLRREPTIAVILLVAAFGFLCGFLGTHMLSAWASVMSLQHHPAVRANGGVTGGGGGGAGSGLSSKVETSTGSSGGDSDKKPGIHVVITSNGNTYMNWQTRVYYRTFLKAQRDPKSDLCAFSRVLHRETDDELMHEIPTSRFSTEHPECDVWCDYPVADRAKAMRQWLETADAQQCEYIMIGETDYLFVQPMPAPKLAPGEGVGFPFGYIVPTYPGIKKALEKLYPPEKGPLSDIPNTGNAPILMRQDDLKRVVPLWEQTVNKMESDAETVEQLGWVREMYAFSIAVALAKVKLDLKMPPKNTLMVQPPADKDVGDASMMHYTWGTEMYTRVPDGPDKFKYTMVWTWDKRTYMGGQYHKITFRLARIAELPEWKEDTYFLQEWFQHAVVKKDLWDIMKKEAGVFNEAIDTINSVGDGLPEGFKTVEEAVKASEPGEVAKAARTRKEREEAAKQQQKAGGR